MVESTDKGIPLMQPTFEKENQDGSASGKKSREKKRKDIYKMPKDNNEFLWTDKKRIIFGLPLTFTTYFLTDSKFIIKSGAIMIEKNEVELYKITDKKVVTGPIGRMCNYGSIVLYSKDTNNKIITIKNVKNPDKVFKLLDDAINKQRDKYHIRGKDMYGGTYYS